MVDSAGRKITLPARIDRVYAAGPPASVLAFAVAPDKLIGWTSPFRDYERAFVAPKYADLPTLGRLTGRGNTANVEVVIAARPDLIFDYGAVRPTFASLADRVQAQTGIPYVLLDGDFDRMADSIELYGERQLALVARALAQEGRIVVMDEPTASLDFGNQVRVLEQVRALAASGIGIVMSTHDPDQAFLCADRVALFHRGTLLCADAPERAVTADHLRLVYGVDVRIETIADEAGRPRRVCMPKLNGGG